MASTYIDGCFATSATLTQTLRRERKWEERAHLEGVKNALTAHVLLLSFQKGRP